MTVIIGIDPHKRSHTAVALDEHDEDLGQVRVAAEPRQVERLLAWAGRWPDRLWAVENANGLGWLLSRQLVDAGEQVRDVPSPGHVYVNRKIAEGKTRSEATRSLKRHLANVVYRALQADLAAKQVSGEDRQAA